MNEKVEHPKETIRIRTGDKVEEHEISVAPLTMVCPGPYMAASKIEYPGRMEIDSVSTIYHAERVKKLHPCFNEAWKLFFKNRDVPTTEPDEIRKMGTGLMHLMGLIDLCLKMTQMGVPIVMKYPETFLHPALQAPIGDFVIYLEKYRALPTKGSPNEFSIE